MQKEKAKHFKLLLSASSRVLSVLWGCRDHRGLRLLLCSSIAGMLGWGCWAEPRVPLLGVAFGGTAERSGAGSLPGSLEPWNNHGAAHPCCRGPWMERGAGSAPGAKPCAAGCVCPSLCCPRCPPEARKGLGLSGAVLVDASSCLRLPGSPRLCSQLSALATLATSALGQACVCGFLTVDNNDALYK